VTLATIATAHFAYSRDIRLAVPHAYLLLGFVMSIVISLVMQGWLGGIVPALEKFLPAAAAFLLLSINTVNLQRLRVVQRSLVLAAIYIAVSAIIGFYQGGEENPYIFWQSVGDEVFSPRLRALGILGDPNDLGQFLLMMIPLAALAWQRRRLARNALVVGVPVTLFLYAIYLTRSRGTLVGAVVMVAVLAEFRLGKAAALLATAPTVLVLLALNFTAGREISLEGGADRLDLWSEGLDLLRSSPLWGIGFGLFTEHSTHTAHNSFLLCASELGLPGYFCWLGLFVVSLIQVQRIGDASPNKVPRPGVERQALALKVSLWGFLATAWFLSRAYRPTPFVPLGMAVALASIDSRHRHAPLLPPTAQWVKLTVALGLGLMVAVYAMVRLGRLV
jgi:O-antigen ligase